ncbi:MAG: YkgJ family cysteine cluster protein, partial [Oscillospiraceae bacterium]|nr:YkgJ family cysteine cluster protein [Oscillospiraceae bacterium]
MTREEMFQDIESMTVGLDDTFKFHCDQCGKCCIHRDDIILSPMDIFKMAKELKISPVDFYHQYCVFHIGDNSRIPIIRLASEGNDNHCVLLKNRRCSVHKVKPAVCGMFPLGRYMSFEKDDYNAESIDTSKVKYLLQPPECGDESETHTVREWLSGFDIKLEDEAFVQWQKAISRFSSKFKELEKKQDMLTMMEIWFVVRVVLYLQYDTSKDFLQQFQYNAENLLKLLDDIPKLKRMVRHAG